MKLNVGILGAGGIARLMAETLNQMESAEAYAVGAREHSRAKAFADEFSIPHAYGSYAELLADEAVELVYIATPHSHHAEQIKQCLAAGKHVLCEKAFTVTAAEAREVLALAKERKLLVTEAIWPRYMPMAETIREICTKDRLGKIVALHGNLGYPVYQKERIHTPSLAGGALLDVGIYPLTFASIALGDDIVDLSTTAVMGDTGVDMQESITLTYRDGAMAVLTASVIGASDRRGGIIGEKGYAVVENINNFEAVSLYDRDHRLIERIERPAQLTGYEYEVQAAVDAIRQGALECPQMPHAQTIRMMELMDQIRHRWNLWYPGEERNVALRS